MLPETHVRLEGKEAESMAKLMSILEDHDDVQNVYVNADIALVGVVKGEKLSFRH